MPFWICVTDLDFHVHIFSAINLVVGRLRQLFYLLPVYPLLTFAQPHAKGRAFLQKRDVWKHRQGRICSPVQILLLLSRKGCACPPLYGDGRGIPCVVVYTPTLLVRSAACIFCAACIHGLYARLAQIALYHVAELGDINCSIAVGVIFLKEHRPLLIRQSQPHSVHGLGKLGPVRMHCQRLQHCISTRFETDTYAMQTYII